LEEQVSGLAPAPATPELHYNNMYEDDRYARMRLERYAAVLRDRIGPDTKLIEIGCYTAALLDYLPKGVDYCGIDFDEAALELARARGARTVTSHLDTESFPVIEKFDIAICTEVLEHLVNPAGTLEKIKGLLNDDGLLLVSLPNENTIYHRIMSLLGKGTDMCAFELYKHLHLPTVVQSRNFLAAHFEIIEESYYINPSAKGSRTEWLGTVVSFVPDFVWNSLADKLPGLFARGTIFLLRKR
jgi:2-polyprenyl-3-methyl-5-hydroxy-6-metoxy-1,4-benzoquinol methylase